MSLADKIITNEEFKTKHGFEINVGDFIWLHDVKEFIKKIKERLVNDDDEITSIIHETIDKEAGQELI